MVDAAKVDRIGEYADRTAKADESNVKTKDEESLKIARDLEAIFEGDEWVEEFDLEKPVKKTTRPMDPKGRNRFTQWVNWKLDQNGHAKLTGARIYQLLKAAKATRSLTRVTDLNSENVARPLTWLSENGHQDRITEVWGNAVVLAGTADQVTIGHTRQAVAEYRKTIGRKAVKQAVQGTKAAKKREMAMQAVRALMDAGDQEAVVEFDTWYREARRRKPVES